MPLYIWELDVVHQVSYHVALQDAEDPSSLYRRGRVLLCINSRGECPVPSQSPQRLDFAQGNPAQVFEDNTACIEWGNNGISRRERAKHIDILKHFAHKVIQNGKMRLVQVATAFQLVDVFTKPLHY